MFLPKKIPTKIHRSVDDVHRGCGCNTSSDEEEGEGGEKKKKKKKGLKEKKEEDTSVPIEKCEEPAIVEEKKGFLDKIKDKLPGHSKKAEEVSPPSPPAMVAVSPSAAEEGEVKEKKGFLDKIKEKLPGYHPKTEEDKEKEKDKECA
ncbi:phosphoprotein ECPP44-like [Actinidia eriantha]|uniref:phosphoprotein ECPP44-like n=1 Tax=Actinidia eriantha TaxID=165200 RepID=UPI002582AC7A|nr:phosphoprotein ECPP44-like [Actinidia eriantha]